MTVYFEKKEKLGDLLVRKGQLKQNQLDRALTHLQTVPQSIGDILVSLGFISEDVLLKALAEQLALPIFAPREGDEYLTPEISKVFLKEHPFIILKRAGIYILVMHDPMDGDILTAADIMVHEPFQIQLATMAAVKKLVAEHYELEHENIRGEDYLIDESDIDKLKDMASEAPVIKYVNNLIDTAVGRRASDIHIESFEEGQLIRFRIDGILQDYEKPPVSMQAAIISRIKLLAALDIAERRIPQDGKIAMRIGGKEVDLRISTMPTIYGEGIVVRILEKGSIILDMNDLGMSDTIEKQFGELITLTNGIVLVTGPTGSGKTTTLYCVLNRINTGSNKIITLEDPVEYQLHGINQTQVRPEIGLTFAKGLRSIVRQDPDVIMVGEIRDYDTAEIAVQSSLTGHLVFSTLHTNDSFSAVIRMIDIGVERFLIASALRGVLAQRLVRCICPSCRKPLGRVSEHLGYMPDGGDFEMFIGEGCHRCTGTGYMGRIGIYELLVMSDQLCRGVSQGLGLEDLKEIGGKEGFASMFQDGLIKVREGKTSLAEIIRVGKGL